MFAVYRFKSECRMMDSYRFQPRRIITCYYPGKNPNQTNLVFSSTGVDQNRKLTNKLASNVVELATTPGEMILVSGDYYPEVTGSSPVIASV